MSWSGTYLTQVFGDLLVHFTPVIYIGIRIYANAIDYVPDSVSIVDKTNVGILGGFLSFFLVLFVNQTNGRFLEMYGFSRACQGRIHNIAGLVQTPPSPKLATSSFVTATHHTLQAMLA